MKNLKSFNEFLNENSINEGVDVYAAYTAKDGWPKGFKGSMEAIPDALGEKNLSKIYIISDMGDDDEDIFEKIQKAFSQSSSKSVAIASTEEGGELRYDEKSNIVMEIGLAGTGYFYTKKSKI